MSSLVEAAYTICLAVPAQQFRASLVVAALCIDGRDNSPLKGQRPAGSKRTGSEGRNKRTVHEASEPERSRQARLARWKRVPELLRSTERRKSLIHTVAHIHVRAAELEY